MAKPKPIRNSANRKLKPSSQKLKLSTIVERLPLLRFLDESKAVLLKLQADWQTWRQQNLPNVSEGAAHLSGYDMNAGQITVCVNNASTAALIKHQKNSLLNAFQLAAKARKIRNPIHSIKVRVNLESTSAATELLENLHNEATQAQQKNHNSLKLDSDSIKSIKNLESSVKNPELAAALNDLATTLSKLSNKKIDK